jgi:hypothetical protein
MPLPYHKQLQVSCGHVVPCEGWNNQTHQQYLVQFDLVRHEMDTVVPVQLRDGTEALPTLLTADGAASHSEVYRAHTGVKLLLSASITTQRLSSMTRLAMCHQIAPRQVSVAA